VEEREEAGGWGLGVELGKVEDGGLGEVGLWHGFAGGGTQLVGWCRGGDCRALRQRGEECIDTAFVQYNLLRTEDM